MRRRRPAAYLVVVAGVTSAALAAAGSAAGFGFRSNAYPVGDGPAAIGVGDFNRDGRQDLAVARFFTSSNGNGITILKGRRHGKFKKAGSYQTNGNPSAVAVGHFNKGRDPDLAVATNGAVSVLLGRSGAKFGATHHFGTYGTEQARGIATADFNRDGDADLAVSNDLGGGELTLLLGNGDGTFGSQQDFPIGSGTKEVAAGRLNGDRVPDVVVVGPTSANEVSVFLGGGGSLVGPPTNYAAGPVPTGLALSDLNRDGRMDLAVSDGDLYQGNSVISVLRGKPAGKFGAPSFFRVGYPGDAPLDVVAAKINGDRRRDLAVANANNDQVAVLRGAGGLSFAPPRYFPVGDNPWGLASGRFDAGRSTDLASANNGGSVSVLLNKR